MTGGTLVASLYAYLVVGAILVAMVYGVRYLNRSRIVTSTGKRLVTVVESTPLAQNTTLHVVKIGEKYFLVGGGMGHVALVGEVPPESVEPWIELQKQTLDLQRASLAGLVARIRGERK